MKMQADPWERQHGESDKAFQAFTLYRDMGPRRSLDGASTLYHSRNAGEANQRPSGSGRRRRKCSGLVALWADRWGWRERAAAWDTHLDQQVRAATEEARREMAGRHAKQAKALQFKAIERLAALEATELTPADTLRYLVEAAKLERLALGEPTETVEQRADPETREAARVLLPLVRGATDEELADLRKRMATIHDRVRSGGGAGVDRPGAGGAESP